MPETDWDLEFYKQGSDACRNYSQLTMRVRTLAQQVLVVSVIGISAIFVKEFKFSEELIILVSVSLLIFGISLGIVDWHYQSAFTAIRNALAKIEASMKKMGPWRAHLEARSQLKDHISSYLPFYLLDFLSLFAIGLVVSRNYVGVLILVGVILITCFLKQCTSAMNRDKSFKAELDKLHPEEKS